MYYAYHEEEDVYDCGIELDMDEAERFLQQNAGGCPFYTPGDEYTVVRKQN